VTTVNNVTRMLDAKKIPYTAFETPAEKLGAEETANFLHVPIELVYKTIVVTRLNTDGKTNATRNKPILAVIPGPNRVDLKMVALALGEKKVALPTEKEAEQITGLLAGGISPLVLINKGFQVIIDEAAAAQDSIHVSGGQRGMNILLRVKDLVELTRAKFAVISLPKN
jgi:Cys-tRNA(Pro)/Cys-tRNA(Cys) deacylase